jgi:hypothetical protein
MNLRAILTGMAAAMAGVAMTALSAPAMAGPIFGAPDDFLIGCEKICQVSFDAGGHISAQFFDLHENPLEVTVAHVASASNPAWVDSNGQALEVTSYTLQVEDPFNHDTGFGSFYGGAVGLCEYVIGGLNSSHCFGPTGDTKTDVVLFKFNPDDQKLHIDYLTDHRSAFNFVTDFNVEGNGPGDYEGGVYLAAGNDFSQSARVLYNFTSDAGVPEPATWAMMLLGFGGLGAVLRLRRATETPATV